MIDDCEGIGGYFVAAPGDVAVRAHQNQRPLIEDADRRIGDAHGAQRHPALCEGALQRRRLRGVLAKPQQREAVPEQVDGGASVGKPGVRRAAAGKRRGVILD